MNPSSGLIIERWIGSLESLREESAAWARDSNWEARSIDTKSIGERDLGIYQVPIWEVRSENAYLTFDPYRRNYGDTLGRVDLLSPYFIIHLDLYEDGWHLVDQNSIDLGGWTFQSFIETLDSIDDLSNASLAS